MAQMVIADVTFSEPPPMPQILYGVVSTESFFVCCPLVYPVKNSKDSQGKTVYRLASGVPTSSGAPPSKPSVEYCQELLEKYGPHSFSRDRKNKNAKTVSVSDVVWSTRFLTRYAVAETFFTYFGGDGPSSGASVCLIGDAAHLHPPAGGQGMNLGLRDAISVGPIIAASLTAGRSQESEEKVRKHMEARRESALKVIKMTKIMAGAVGMSPALQAKFAWSPIHIYTIRDWAFWAVSKSQWIRERLAFQFSGLASP
jgi:2-polyprenyl-6-methoxyphenol hydroxylase-like FAD-dependent oxidoreductase